MALSLGPAGAGSGASASSIDLPSLTPPTDLSTKLREGIKTGWIEYPDGTKTKVIMRMGLPFRALLFY